MKSVKFAIAATLFAAASGAFATTDERGGYDVAPFVASTATRSALPQGNAIATDERGDYDITPFLIRSTSKSPALRGDSMITGAVSERHMAL